MQNLPEVITWRELGLNFDFRNREKGAEKGADLSAVIPSEDLSTLSKLKSNPRSALENQL
jgi:hypothetical protein